MGPHENVMSLVEVLEDDSQFYIVLPFCDGGEICQWFERKRFSLPEQVGPPLTERACRSGQAGSG